MLVPVTTALLLEPSHVLAKLLCGGDAAWQLAAKWREGEAEDGEWAAELKSLM